MKKINRIYTDAITITAVALSLHPHVISPATAGSAGNPYPNMPVIAPIGERIEKYITVNESAKGPSIDPNKGYRFQKLGKGLYMITDNTYQSMFMVYENGVVVVDAPPPFAQHIPKAIAEVTNKPITHLVYSHSISIILVVQKV